MKIKNVRSTIPYCLQKNVPSSILFIEVNYQSTDEGINKIWSTQRISYSPIRTGNAVVIYGPTWLSPEKVMLSERSYSEHTLQEQWEILFRSDVPNSKSKTQSED